MAQLLTEKLVEKATANAIKPTYIYDAKLPGFGVRINPNGAKTFIFRKRVHGIERQVTIGRCPAWSVASARETAMELAVKMDQGVDPVAERRKEREAPTFDDVWEKLYSPRVLSRKNAREQRNERSMFRDYIAPVLGSKRVKDITAQDIDKVHRRASEKAPVRANRVLQVVKCAFNLALEDGWIAINPAQSIRKNAEQARERYLSTEERQRLVKALNEHTNQKFANIVRLLMLTGSRRGEVQSAEWSMFDLEQGVWTKPSSHTKQKKIHIVPLSETAVRLLKDIRRTTNSKYVFPQDGNPEAHTMEIKKFWADILKKAEINNFRIHDLRHDFASRAVSTGYSLPVIGHLLGHTQPGTTARYAHLMLDPLREATSRLSQDIGF